MMSEDDELLAIELARTTVFTLAITRRVVKTGARREIIDEIIGYAAAMSADPAAMIEWAIEKFGRNAVCIKTQ